MAEETTKKLTTQNPKNTAFAFKQSGTLVTAIELDLFTKVSQGSPASVIRHMGLPMERLKEKYIATGKIVNDGLDSTYHNSFDNNAYVYMELEYHYDAADPESVNEARRCVSEERDQDREEKSGFEPNDIGLCLGDYTKTLQERILDMGPHCGDFHVWQERIKRAFDPLDVSDRSNYGAGLLARQLPPQREP